MSRIGVMLSGVEMNRASGDIAPETGVGAVHLDVTDPDAAMRFYGEVLGLTLLGEDDGVLTFGAPGRELVVLHPGARGPVEEGHSGLYHLAIVIPSRKELARVIARLYALRYPNSPTDHVMTKADYLWDPDGNGIEVYAETPEDGEWFFLDDGFGARDAQGRQRSGRDPIDLDELFKELSPEDVLSEPMPEGTKMGHVHLHVADIDRSLAFYSDIIGFDLMGRSHRFGMAFVSAGGYHHHVGLNTWAGEGAPPRPAGTAGLRRFSVEVPSSSDLDAVADRTAEAGVRTDEGDDSLTLTDPSGNALVVKIR